MHYKTSVHMRLFLFILLITLLSLSLSFVYAQQDTAIVIYRDEDSLTLYIPNDGTVSLEGFRLEVFDSSGDVTSYGLDYYPQFRGPLGNFANVPTPICLRLERNGTPNPLPLECQNGAFTLIQTLSDADIFWYDTTSRQGNLVRVGLSETIGLCPPQEVTCSFSYANIAVANVTQAAGSVVSNPSLIGLEGLPVSTNREWVPYGQVFRGVEMMLVPAGCFTMGSTTGRDNELMPHTQCFDFPFWIDRTEVTNAQYGSGGWWPDATRPRDTVNWFDATAFCETRGTRLPTEAEWEYAARGPDSLEYPWGNTFNGENAVYGLNSGGQTGFTAEKIGGRSWVGTYDMSGNVWEWMSSLDIPYPYNALDGREDQTIVEGKRVLRGGTYWSGEIQIRSAFRSSEWARTRQNTYGFRCARDYDPAELDMLTFRMREAMPESTPTPFIPTLRVLSGANLRGGPGTEYAVNGSAKQGQDLMVIARADNNGTIWYLIRDLDNVSKWISSQVIELRNVTNDEIPLRG